MSVKTGASAGAAEIRPSMIEIPRRSLRSCAHNQLDTGGHFAAWEQPQLYSEEVRTGLRSLR